MWRIVDAKDIIAPRCHLLLLLESTRCEKKLSLTEGALAKRLAYTSASHEKHRLNGLSVSGWARVWAFAWGHVDLCGSVQ